MITQLGSKRVFPIGIGTWRIGGGAVIKDTENDKKAIASIKFALDSGINVIDTAEIYGQGHAEELVGEAIKRRNRENLYIISKVFLNHLDYDSVIKAAEGSLKRMQTKYIDLYLIHWPNPFFRIDETIRAMEDLIDKGKIMDMGVSNFNTRNLQKAIWAAKRHRILANEISYSLMKKDAEIDTIPFCARNNIKIIAHTPLAQGRVLKMQEVREMADKYEKKPVQVALNYLMKKSLPIPKAEEKKHLKEIMGSVGWSLSEQDYKRLSEL